MSSSNTPPRKRILIVGCGYTGSRVAQQAKLLGHEVFALTRSKSRFEQLESWGATPVLGHWHKPQTLNDLPQVDWILIAIPHRDENSLLELTHCSGLTNLVAALPQGWSKLVYLSTTGVYGECNGAIVDEHTQVSPARMGPSIALAGEQWLAEKLPAGSHTTLRLAGIYGPNRVPLAGRLAEGEPLAVPRHGYLNLVHVDDVAAMVLKVAAMQAQLACYVFSDDNPVQREEFYRHVARQAGIDQPTFVDPDSHDPRQRRATDKRISPARLLEETQHELRFPDYQAGLADAMKTPT